MYIQLYKMNIIKEYEMKILGFKKCVVCNEYTIKIKYKYKKCYTCFQKKKVATVKPNFDECLF